MTRTEALALARAKWGAEIPAAQPGIDATSRRIPQGAAMTYEEAPHYRVGYFRGHPTFAGLYVEGAGDSWESACKAAGLL